DPAGAAGVADMAGAANATRMIGTTSTTSMATTTTTTTTAGVVGVWVGGGELAERVGRLARSAPGPPVLLAGERTDIQEILPAFDVFVLPSRYEGLPTAVVEAMVCGIPVVATAVNAVGDVVVPGETGLLVPPHRPDLLAEAVNYLLDRPDTAARMATNARERLGTRFDVTTLRDTLAAAYTDQR
ncbi:MAG: glycosyltransferase, partial [Trebonia sp.]